MLIGNWREVVSHTRVPRLAAVYGHSHVRHVEQLRESCGWGEWPTTNGWVVDVFARGGMRVRPRDLDKTAFQRLILWRPSLVLVHLRDNDLCQRSMDDIVSNMLWLRRRFVFLGCIVRPDNVQYNNTVLALNQRLALTFLFFAGLRFLALERSAVGYS